ncbi:hypothetical protein FHS83_000398 [Rhizomicrobium palustre]|uniref:Uncharacterized protein n=1 Tax=Rhizomicrobium palustre TaxID=189966 RepID=A0A846MVI9_9PROT|nr:hypothetical protein [Rhizomicrobium palustre]NIK87080.1 hypothetical protein [Rhizomicrobium palustre]
MAPLSPASRDEQRRHDAADSLIVYLSEGRKLLEFCKAVINAEEEGDQIGPVLAAAKVMNAGANIAKSLGPITLVERRSRTIVEVIQPPESKTQDLNSRFSKWGPKQEEEVRKVGEIERRLAAIVNARLEQDEAEARAKSKDGPP